MEWLYAPWPWYVGGVMVGLTVPMLLFFGNKQFGISSSLRHVCAACVPGDFEYFKYDWRSKMWNLVFVLGIGIGGFLGGYVFANPDKVEISEQTSAVLSDYGITDLSGMVPVEIFSWEALATPVGILFVVVGGFFVGFGTRWANGCTSGHAIMGLSLLSKGSLLAVVGFFIGGLIMTHLVFPLIF